MIDSAMTHASKGGATNQNFSAVGITYGHARPWWRWTFHGLRAFPDSWGSVFHAEGDTPFYWLAAGWPCAHRLLCCQSGLGDRSNDAACRLEVTEADGRQPAIAARCPPWSEVPQ